MLSRATIFIVLVVATPWAVKGSVEDILAGLSTPDLNSLLKDMDYEQYNSALNGLEYGEAPEYFMPPESEQKKINERAETAFRPVEGKPLFERPKGVIANKEESNGKASAAVSHQATTSAAEANAAAAAMLPAYCDPPNPCPLGYTDRDGCIEDFENTSEFSRIYQSRQKCICDSEHMFNCPENSLNNNDNEAEEDNEIDGGADSHHSFLSGTSGFGNPYLTGQKLPVAAKKGMNF